MEDWSPLLWPALPSPLRTMVFPHPPARVPTTLCQLVFILLTLILNSFLLRSEKSSKVLKTDHS